MKIRELFRLRNNITCEQVDKILSRNREEKDLLCICGNVKTVFYTKNIISLGHTCGKKECCKRYGRKRPEHSLLMRKYAKEGKNSSNWKKGYKNTFVNSIKWKRRVLTNKNIDHSHISDKELPMFFNKIKGNWAINKDSLIRKIKNLYERFNSEYYLEDYIDIMKIHEKNVDELKNIIKPLNSLLTIISNKNGRGVSKKFKRTTLSDFKFNAKDQKEVTTRSSYETNYINFFEKNKIWWEYETLHIKTLNGYTVPDFIFYYKGKTYILEVKGFLLDENEYFQNKLKYVYNYAKNNNMQVLFTYKSSQDKIEKLIKEVIEFK